MLRIYDFECPQCGTVKEEIVDHTEDHIKCPNCIYAVMSKLPSRFNAHMGAAGAHGYYDENLGCYIHTNRQRREEMRRQNVAESYGKGWY